MTIQAINPATNKVLKTYEEMAPASVKDIVSKTHEACLLYTSPVLKVAMMRPWGAAFWSMYYKSLYPTSPPADLGDYRRALRNKLKEPGRMEALQQMLGASKASCEARIAEVKAPVLVLMGTKDPDFGDPAAEASLVATRLRGRLLMVKGAGHYPHAEMPGEVEPAIIKFLGDANGGTTGPQATGA